MKYGVVFPQTEIGEDVAVIRDFVTTVEAMGFDYLMAYDHVIGANPNRPEGWTGPYTHESMFHEVFTLFAYVAAITSRIELATGILILPQRQTTLVAKQAAQIDVLSHGRLRLGVGIGWNAVEYEALNENFHNRGKRSEEQVQLLRRLWTEELVTFEGRYHRVTDAGLNPLPIQQPIPIWFGGGVDAVLERMARLGDGWMPNAMPLEKAEESVGQLRNYLREHGRRIDEFGIDIRVSASRQKPEEWAGYIKAWQKLGATHVAITTTNAGFTTLEEHLEVIAQFANQMGVRG